MKTKDKLHEAEEESAKVYNSLILHFLSKNHIAPPLIIFFSTGLALSIYAKIEVGLSYIDLVIFFPIGIISFTLVEYLIHRFLYHLPQVYEKGNIPYALHGIHHKYPKDKKRLVMPPILSVFLASLILAIYYWLMGDISFVFTAGFLFGYAAYLSVHYIVHRFKPPRNFLKQLWIHHSIHHYKDDKVAFGVSSPLWDYVFGTMPKKNKL